MEEKKLENLIAPESKLERIRILEEARKVLKSEFVGLDSIIDEIIKCVSPWYITPEVLERPIVVSLFGMSGTGKTSIVRRLTELLRISWKTVEFDCGEESNESSSMSIVDRFTETLGLDTNSFITEESTNDVVFVFDEFQYARTINESGEEVIKPTLRPIWNIIDSGKLSVNEYRYGVSHFMNFFDDFAMFAESHEEMKIKDGEIQDRESVRAILLDIGLFHYGRDIKQLLRGKDDGSKDIRPASSDEEEEDVLAPLKILDNTNIGTIVKKLNMISPRYGYEKYQELEDADTLGKFYEILKDVKKIIMTPKVINCSRALVFIIGNLDEAFRVQSDLSADVDADNFYYQTSSVSISDIKEALKTRFRAEQIARFGNNLIKYPTLKKVDFQKIIEKELDRVVTKFYSTEGIQINVSQGIKDLLYYEGVFPSQGVRPVFTTIGSFFTTLLSDILIHYSNNPEEVDRTVRISIENEEKGDISFNKKEISIIIKYGEGISERKDIPLQLGPLRDPGRRKTRYCNSVHEAGHAIVYIHETGEFPKNIVAVSSGDGGFCDTYNKKQEGEIDTREDVDSEMRTLLGGYCAEELVFEDRNKCLMGSSSDITNAWEYFSDVSYKCGYFNPICFSDPVVENGPSGIPGGILDTVELPYRFFTDKSLKDSIKNRWIDYIEETKFILNEEKELLRQVSLELGEKGSMTGERLEQLVLKYGNKLTEEYIRETRKDKSGEYYLEKLMNFK